MGFASLLLRCGPARKLLQHGGHRLDRVHSFRTSGPARRAFGTCEHPIELSAPVLDGEGDLVVSRDSREELLNRRLPTQVVREVGVVDQRVLRSSVVRAASSRPSSARARPVALDTTQLPFTSSHSKRPAKYAPARRRRTTNARNIVR